MEATIQKKSVDIGNDAWMKFIEQMQEEAARHKMAKKASGDNWQPLSTNPDAHKNLDEILEKPGNDILQIAHQPLKPGQPVLAESVAPLGNGPSNMDRVKSIGKFLGGMAVPVATTLAVRAAITMSVTAAFPAVAPVILPAAFLAYSAYKLGTRTQEIMGKLNETKSEFQKEGMSGPRAFLKAVSENKFKTGMLVGSAIGLCIGATFTMDHIGDFLSAHQSVSVPEVAIEPSKVSVGADITTAQHIETQAVPPVPAADTAAITQPVSAPNIEVHDLPPLPAADTAAITQPVSAANIEVHDLPPLPAADTAAITQPVADPHSLTPAQPITAPPSPEQLAKTWDEIPGSLNTRLHNSNFADALQKGIIKDPSQGLVTIGQDGNVFFTRPDPLHPSELETFKINNSRITPENQSIIFSDPALANAPVAVGRVSLGSFNMGFNSFNADMGKTLDMVSAHGGDPKVGIIQEVRPTNGGATMNFHIFRGDDGQAVIKMVTPDHLHDPAIAQAYQQTPKGILQMPANPHDINEQADAAYKGEKWVPPGTAQPQATHVEPPRQGLASSSGIIPPKTSSFIIHTQPPTPAMPDAPPPVAPDPVGLSRAEGAMKLTLMNTGGDNIDPNVIKSAWGQMGVIQKDADFEAQLISAMDKGIIKNPADGIITIDKGGQMFFTREIVPGSNDYVTHKINDLSGGHQYSQQVAMSDPALSKAYISFRNPIPGAESDMNTQVGKVLDILSSQGVNPRIGIIQEIPQPNGAPPILIHAYKSPSGDTLMKMVPTGHNTDSSVVDAYKQTPSALRVSPTDPQGMSDRTKELEAFGQKQPTAATAQMTQPRSGR